VRLLRMHRSNVTSSSEAASWIKLPSAWLAASRVKWGGTTCRGVVESCSEGGGGMRDVVDFVKWQLH
jgi:hypothetical protein